MPPGGAIHMRGMFTLGFMGQREPRVPQSRGSVSFTSPVSCDWSSFIILLYSSTHPEKNSTSDSGSCKSLPRSGSVVVGLVAVNCLAGCFWAVEVRAGLCRLLWMLLLSNQNSRMALDSEPGADTAWSRVFTKVLMLSQGRIHFTNEFVTQETVGHT